jgi:hypothetical protein
MRLLYVGLSLAEHLLHQLGLTKIEYALSLVTPLAICLTRGKKVSHQLFAFIFPKLPGRDISISIVGC